MDREEHVITNGVQPGGCFDGNPQQLLAGAAAGQLGCWAVHFFGGIGEGILSGILRIMQRQMKITQGGKPQKRFEASSDLVPLAIG